MIESSILESFRFLPLASSCVRLVLSVALCLRAQVSSRAATPVSCHLSLPARSMSNISSVSFGMVPSSGWLDAQRLRWLLTRRPRHVRRGCIHGHSPNVVAKNVLRKNERYTSSYAKLNVSNICIALII